MFKHFGGSSFDKYQLIETIAQKGGTKAKGHVNQNITRTCNAEDARNCVFKQIASLFTLRTEKKKNFNADQ